MPTAARIPCLCWCFYLLLSNAAAASIDCAAALDELMAAARCPVAPAQQLPSPMPWGPELATRCNISDLTQLQPVLSVSLSTPADPAYIAAIQRYNATRPPDAWPVVIASSGAMADPSRSVLPWDVYLGNALELGNFVGRVAPITNELLMAVAQPKQLDPELLKVLATVQAQGVYYGTQRLAMLTSAPAPLLYYRHDILRQAGVSPNMLNTWGGVLQAATLLHGKDWDEDGQTEYGFCVDRQYACGLVFLLTLVGPIDQTQGTHQGALVDAGTGEFLALTPALALTVAMYQKLAALGAPSDADTCTYDLRTFAQGRCAISYSNSIAAFNVLSQSNISRVRGKFSTLPGPGSDIVYDRATRTLVPCDDLTCPYANLEKPQEPSLGDPYQPVTDYMALLRPDASTAALMNVTQGSKLAGGQRINRSPEYGQTHIGMIHGGLSKQGQGQAVRLLKHLASESTSWQVALAEGAGAGPMYYSQFRLSDLTSTWLGAGYDPVAVPSLLASLDRVYNWGVNAMALYQFPYTLLLWFNMMPATIYLNQGAPTGSVMTAINDIFMSKVQEFFGSYDVFMGIYKQSLSYRDVPRQVPSPPLVPVTPPLSSDKGHKASLTAILAGVITPTLAVGVTAVVLLALRRLSQHRTFLGRVKAPKLGPDLTFVVAHVQAWHRLKEECPPFVSSQSLIVLDGIIQELLSAHTGYQMPTSTPECLRAAFYCPADAAHFALELHNHLLTARWPRQLLESDRFHPVHLEPSATHDGMIAAINTTQMAQQNEPSILDTPLHLDTQLSTAHDDFDAAAAAQVTRKISMRPAPPLSRTFGDQCARSWRLCNTAPLAAAFGHTVSLFLARAGATATGNDQAAATASNQDSMLGVGQDTSNRGARGRLASLSQPLNAMDATQEGAPGTLFVGSLARRSTADVSDGPEDRQLERSYTVDELMHVMRQGSVVMAPRSAKGSVSGGPQAGKAPKEGVVVVSSGLQVCIGLCAACTSEVVRHKNPSTSRMVYSGQALDIAESTAAAGQGGMTLIPQWTFRLLPVEVMAQDTLFCHWGEYQFTPELTALDVYLALDKTRLGLLSMYRPLTPASEGCTLNPGVLAAPVERAAMVFSHIVGVQTLMAWNYEETVAALDVFTRLAQRQLNLLDGYLVEHVSGFVLSAFKEPGAAILWAMHLQDLMMREKWSEELLSHELCEEVLVSNDVLSHSETLVAPQGVAVEQVTALLSRGPRLKAGIDVGPILAALNTVTGRMAYRGKVMNRAARLAALALSGQVLCSAEGLTAAGGVDGLNELEAEVEPVSDPSPGRMVSFNPHNCHNYQTHRCMPTSQDRMSATPYHTVASASLGSPPGHHTIAAASLGSPPGHHTIATASLGSPMSSSRLFSHTGGIRADDLGWFQLKGVAEKIQVFHCFRRARHLQVIKRRPEPAPTTSHISSRLSMRLARPTTLVTTPTA